MPTDLSPEVHDLIHVRDRAGIGLPFSRGLMATSILATGLETAHAYRIAASIQAELRRHGRREVDTNELAELASRALAAEAGVRAEARYRAWRDVRHVGRPIVICLSGAPGVGKSTMATRLAVRLGVTRVLPTDAIREVLRTVIPDTVLPELHRSTFERIVRDGEPEISAFGRQASAVSAAAGAVAHRMAAEGRHIIVEGVHLLPGEIHARLGRERPRAIVVEFLLTLPEADAHRAQLQRRWQAEPERDGHRHLANFETIRAQQADLQRRAERVGVPEHDISRPETLTQRIVDRIVERVEAGARVA